MLFIIISKVLMSLLGH